MVNENREEQPSTSEVISDETGALDVRFTLWRRFCAENDVSVDSLPSELSEEAKEKWSKLKETELTGSDEQ